MKTKLSQNKMATYLAVTAGTGCATSVANAAVTYYINDGLASAPGWSVSTAPSKDAGQIEAQILFNAPIKLRAAVGDKNKFIFRSSYSFTPSSSYTKEDRLLYFYNGNIQTTYGAELGDNNFSSVDLNGDGIEESVVQFLFDGTGAGYVKAVASDDGGAAMSFSDGVALIQSVPEPSSIALLALGATGLLARRRRVA